MGEDLGEKAEKVAKETKKSNFLVWETDFS